MLWGKKKILQYLGSIGKENETAFAQLLQDCLNGSLKAELQKRNIRKTDIHIDLSADTKCIGIAIRESNTQGFHRQIPGYASSKILAISVYCCEFFLAFPQYLLD